MSKKEKPKATTKPKTVNRVKKASPQKALMVDAEGATPKVVTVAIGIDTRNKITYRINGKGPVISGDITIQKGGAVEFSCYEYLREDDAIAVRMFIDRVVSIQKVISEGIGSALKGQVIRFNVPNDASPGDLYKYSVALFQGKECKHKVVTADPKVVIAN
jgi:hypothetical protein